MKDCNKSCGINQNKYVMFTPCDNKLHGTIIFSFFCLSGLVFDSF